MKTVLNLFLTIVFITSCSAQKLSDGAIVGKYQSKKGEPFTELVLNKDNSFKYKQVAGLYKSKSEGTWKLKDKKIVLMSKPAFKTDMIEVSETDTQKERTIKVVGEDNKPYADVVVKIKHSGNDLVKTTNNDGIIVLEQYIDIKSFEVNFLGESYSYRTSKKSTSFNVILYLDTLDKKYFNNEEAVVKKNSILLEGIKLSL